MHSIATNLDVRDIADRLIDPVEALLRRAEKVEADYAPLLAKLAEPQASSGRNLAHYLAVRQLDIRELQFDLHRLGLSSLGRMETHVLSTLRSVLRALRSLSGGPPLPESVPPVDFDEGRRRLRETSSLLFGETAPEDETRIMVTVPSDAADRYDLVHALVEAGMNVMRINCSKDDPPRWTRMIDHLRRAESELGRRCKVMMDLAGPNPRTGPLRVQAKNLRFEPPAHAGQVIDAARVWISASGVVPQAAESVVPIAGLDSIAGDLLSGDRVRLAATDGKPVHLQVTAVEDDGAWADCWEAASVPVGSNVELMRRGQVRKTATVGHLPDGLREQTFRVQPGDVILLDRHCTAGHGPERDNAGNVTSPARIGCTLPTIFNDVRVCDRVLYDDGEMEAVVRKASADELELEVRRARKGSVKIRSAKGLNFPDTDLNLPPMTEKDLSDLAFVAEHADAVGMSFVRYPRDVEALIEQLDRLDATDVGVVLKVETEKAFRHLPELLMVALRRPPVGVMVARGDMGPEFGFDRMSEVQEQILWLCEAAHVPVIWATQVLESLAKKGLPTRSEVTDAAMSSRAECVMLNKGDYIVDAVRFLRDVLRRMQGHQDKKFSMLRRLSVSGSAAPDEFDAV
ncbi:MAG: pyruvate kinase [Planctomycetota bacterium]